MIADIFGGIAALAALLTVYYARATVGEAQKARRETSAAHEDEMDRESQLLDATQSAHEREMVERSYALERELWLERLRQLSKVQDLLRETADIARYEISNPPQRIAGQLGTWTRTTGALARIEAAVVMLEGLGGPSLPKLRQTTVELRHLGTPLERMAGETTSALAATLHLPEEHDSLKAP